MSSKLITWQHKVSAPAVLLDVLTNAFGDTCVVGVVGERYKRVDYVLCVKAVSFSPISRWRDPDVLKLGG